MKNIKRKSTTEQIIDVGKKKKENVVFEDNKNFVECINILAATKEGQYVFNRLMQRCGAMRSLAVLDANRDIDENVLQVNVGRQSVWYDEIYNYMNIINKKKILFFDRRKICQQKRKVQDKV